MRHNFMMGSRDHATELVEGYISEHKLAAGDRLPSERDMCEMWGLNRTTLRNAIKRLISTGTLCSKVGSGTYVAPQKLVRDLHDTKGFSEVARAAGFNPTTEVLSFEMREADKTSTRKLHIPLGSKVYVLRRVRNLDGVPAMIETTQLNAALFPGLDRYDFSNDSLFRVMREEYGVDPVEGDEKLSVTRLDELEADALGFPAGNPAFFQMGVMVDSEGVPLEYFKGVVLSERVRIACELMN